MPTTFMSAALMKRRQFLSATATGVAVTGAALVAENVLSENVFAQNQPKSNSRLHVAVNQYTCDTLYKRENINFWTRLDEIKTAGVDGVEVSLGSSENVAAVGKRLADHGLAMRSIYTGGKLHDENSAEKEVARLLAIGEAAKSCETKFIVFNPDAKSGKSDAELILQSKQMDILGAGLKKLGIALAFHYHTSELEFGGREFYHILCGTEPANVTLCFEQHWSYRACGNSEVAMFDHLKLYADRSSVVHLRQSNNNVWSETFGDGDINNVRLAAELKKLPQMPHVVLEQAPENGTPKTMSPADVLRQSADYIRKVFG